ncbi:hypothetical protein [Spirosoma linguale]|uniref:Uncharacterized protein n=1 Tax=Spirosoma linguale (strain ATCC 33905 / DSM 74 / LMG 10896 / Claus 1) TaxID=504472 RepID=D2QV29_SPILD|nr:hypothetical protein Slin_6705 [Spirosoma linguale DSM 74]
MITLWISASLLALTGWQGYRLGKEYGWWGRNTTASEKGKVVEMPSLENTISTENGLGRSKTNFGKLLGGFKLTSQQAFETDDSSIDDETEEPIIEPATTLMPKDGLTNEIEYPAETDQIPETCSWMDDEAISLVDFENDEEPESDQSFVPLNEYVKRVHTVQRKMTQLNKRRNADTSFVKQDLGQLINTYQLENDQALDWLFQQQEQTSKTDYGSLFDRIESLTT